MSVVVAVAVGSCGGNGGDGGRARPGESTTTAAGEPSPRAYLAEVADTVRRHAYYADRVDWAAWEASLPEVVADADDAADTYPAVRRLVADLDAHSGLITAAQARGRSFAPDRLPRREQPAGSVDDGGVGRIALPLTFWDPEDRLGAEYVTRAWRVLASDACGWVVDLRAGGGNAWTLLMALAPLLGPGPGFGFAFREGETETVSIRRDGSLAGGGRPPVAAPAGVAMPAGLATVPAAIVQSRRTASAHEFAVMGFAGRVSTRTFGSATHGVPTAREDYTLDDGSVLYLTTALGVDRRGRMHDGPIAPAVKVDGDRLQAPAPGLPDPAIEAARAWLARSPRCG